MVGARLNLARGPVACLGVGLDDPQDHLVPVILGTDHGAPIDQILERGGELGRAGRHAAPIEDSNLHTSAYLAALLALALGPDARFVG